MNLTRSKIIYMFPHCTTTNEPHFNIKQQETKLSTITKLLTTI